MNGVGTAYLAAIYLTNTVPQITEKKAFEIIKEYAKRFEQKELPIIQKKIEETSFIGKNFKENFLTKLETGCKALQKEINIDGLMVVTLDQYRANRLKFKRAFQALQDDVVEEIKHKKIPEQKKFYNQQNKKIQPKTQSKGEEIL